MKTTALDSLIRAFEHRERTRAPQFAKIAVTELPGFRDFEISPKTDFVAVCGGTGTGKTALLELIFAAMGFSHLLPERQIHRLGAAQLQLEIDINATRHARNFDLLLDDPSPDFPADVQFLDLGRRTIGPLAYFREKGAESVKEGSSSKAFEKSFIDLCSFICRKDYTTISFIEVDDGDERFPFFEIATAKTQYDSFSASTGELSVLYLAWALMNAEPNSIFLIEEPEAYLPPIGQSAVIYILFKAVVDRGHAVFLTTHSAEIVSKIPDEEIISIRSNQGISEIPGTKVTKARVLSKLGLGPSKSAVLFVEDEAAKDVVEEILASSPLSDLVTFEVAVAGNGDGAVKKATEAIPLSLKNVLAIGVLDGDMRGKSKKWKHLDRFCFTPFETGIEHEMLEAIYNDVDAFADRLGREPDGCLDAFELGQGVEVHRRFAETAKALRTTSKSLRGYAYPHWLKSPDNAAKVAVFIQDLTEKVGLSK